MGRQIRTGWRATRSAARPCLGVDRRQPVDRRRHADCQGRRLKRWLVSWTPTLSNARPSWNAATVFRGSRQRCLSTGPQPLRRLVAVEPAQNQRLQRTSVRTVSEPLTQHDGHRMGHRLLRAHYPHGLAERGDRCVCEAAVPNVGDQPTNHRHPHDLPPLDDAHLCAWRSVQCVHASLRLRHGVVPPWHDRPKLHMVAACVPRERFEVDSGKRARALRDIARPHGQRPARSFVTVAANEFVSRGKGQGLVLPLCRAFAGTQIAQQFAGHPQSNIAERMTLDPVVEIGVPRRRGLPLTRRPPPHACGIGEKRVGRPCQTGPVGSRTDGHSRLRNAATRQRDRRGRSRSKELHSRQNCLPECRKYQATLPGLCCQRHSDARAPQWRACVDRLGAKVMPAL